MRLFTGQLLYLRNKPHPFPLGNGIVHYPIFVYFVKLNGTMKKIFSLLAFFPFVLFAQDQTGHCSHVKSVQHQQLRSNTFSLTQIAETEEYDVHYYFLDLNMSNTTTALSGSGEIHAKTRVNMDSALFEFYPTFTISAVQVDGIPCNYTRSNSAVKVPVNKSAGQTFTIRVEYNGTPPTAATNPLGGGGMTNDFSPSWGNQVTWSLSEPFSAYEWFPVKQSLKDKADSCQVWITVPDNCKAGSNGVLVQEVDLGNGTRRFEWKHRHPIDYYLISVSVAQYVEYNLIANSAGSGPVLIQNFIYDNPATLPNFQNDIDETVDFIELFATLFGPYPFADEKYGHCMAPISGGMEHQTMTTQGFFTNTLTAHELAHQWWGNHVTCASWSDIWINEGFASYAEYLMLADLYPGQEVTDMLDRHNNIKNLPGGSVWVEDSLNDARIFSGRLTYNKGAAIVHTLRFLIDDDLVFFNGLKNFQSLYADSTASGMDFISVMENESGMDFTAFMQEWYFGEGFPTYSVRWNNVGNVVYVEINQSASMPSVTPLFTNDIELRFDRISFPDTTIRFSINGTSNQFTIPILPGVNNIVSIDPDNWIINNNGTIVKDPNFLLSTNEISEDDRIKIYPNPTEGPLRIEMKNPGRYLLTLVDIQGKVILNTEFENQLLLDLGQYAKGSYLLQIKDEQSEMKIRRIIRN